MLMRLNFALWILLTALTFPSWGQELALQLDSFKDGFEKDVPATMKKVSELGFREVELANTYGLSFPDLIRLLAQNNLSVLSFATEWERLERFPQSIIDEARSYGAKYIVCPGPAEMTLETADNIIATLNSVGKLVSRNGLLLCFQPGASTYSEYNGQTYFDYIVQKIDIRYVHFKMDVFSARHGGKDPVAILKKYPTRFVLVQLNDRKRGTSNFTASAGDAIVPLGKGDVGIHDVYITAKDLGIQHVIIENTSAKPEQQIAQGLMFIKALNHTAKNK